MEKKFHFFAYNTSMSVHKKSQPNRSSRLAGNTQHKYECLVLLYMIILYMRARVSLEGLSIIIDILHQAFFI